MLTGGLVETGTLLGPTKAGQPGTWDVRMAAVPGAPQQELAVHHSLLRPRAYETTGQREMRGLRMMLAAARSSAQSLSAAELAAELAATKLAATKELPVGSTAAAAATAAADDANPPEPAAAHEASEQQPEPAAASEPSEGSGGRVLQAAEAVQPDPHPEAGAGLTTCGGCHVAQPKGAFSGSQQKKPDGQGRCKTCVGTAAAAAPVARASGNKKKKKKKR